MSRHDREGSGRGPAMERTPLLSPGTMRGAMLVGVAMLMFLGYVNWDQSRRIQKSLDGRLGEIENQLELISAKVNQPAPRQARRGPDPNRVYKVRTQNAPFKGPKNAPVTVVEFSDFQ